MSKRIAALLSGLERFGRLSENAALVTLLGSMILLGVGQILLREVFGTGIFWADELIKLIVLWLAMIGSIAACREDRHIRIDALSHLLPDNAVTAVRLLVDVFAAVVCAVIAWQAWRYLQVEIEYEVTVLIDTPAWLAHSVLPLAFALVSFRFGVAALSDLHGAISGSAAGNAE